MGGVRAKPLSKAAQKNNETQSRAKTNPGRVIFLQFVNAISLALTNPHSANQFRQDSMSKKESFKLFFN